MKHFKLFITIIIPVFCLLSCGKDTARGKWTKSVEDIEVFVPFDFEDHYDKSTLHCVAESKQEETGIPMPPFKIEVKAKGDGKNYKFENHLLPSIVPTDSLRFEYKDGSYSIFAGKFNKEGIQDYCWDYTISGDTLKSLVIGKFKNNTIESGYVLRAYDDVTIYTEGEYKNGALYLGIKQKQFPDSIGDKIIGVWQEDGSLNKTYLTLIRQLRHIDRKHGLNDDEIEINDINFTHRYFFWLKHKWFVLIGLSAIGLILFICFANRFPGVDMTPNEKKEWRRKNYRIKPWTIWGAFWRWLIFGPLRIDLYYLQSYKAFKLYYVMFWTCLVASSKFLILYGLYPRYWWALLDYAGAYWQTYLFIVCVDIWIVQLIFLPYWVYKNNHLAYRHNIYEHLILNKQRLEYAALFNEIPKTVSKDIPRIKDISKEAQTTYNNELGLVSKAFSWLTNSKVRHAREKAEALDGYLTKMSNIAENHSRLFTELCNFLDIERKNAYRNMILAKELIILVHSAKGKKNKLQVDNIGNLHVDQPQPSILDLASLPEVDLEKSFTIGFSKFDETFQSLKEYGFDDKDNVFVSLGLGSIEMALDGISQINQRRNAEREHYEYYASKFIQDVIKMEKDLLGIHAKMLRANEIMKSLSAANEVFVNAYSPLRDFIFGKNPSIKGYIDYLFNKRRAKKNAKSVIVDLSYLIAVCTEYNKINTSKL